MKKVKMLAVAGALLLTTVGVFAGKSRFVNSIYAYDSATGVYHTLATGATLVDYSTTQVNGAPQAQATDKNANLFLLFATQAQTSPIYANQVW